MSPISIKSPEGFDPAGLFFVRDGRQHRGIILLRLDDETPKDVIRALTRLMTEYTDEIDHHVMVVTETGVRFNRGTGGAV